MRPVKGAAPTSKKGGQVTLKVQYMLIFAMMFAMIVVPGRLPQRASDACMTCDSNNILIWFQA